MAGPTRALTSRRASPARIVLVLLLAVGGIWISLAVTIALVLGTAKPDVALRWWPRAAEASASAAALIMGNDADTTQRDRAMALAEEALSREPANAVAARDAGLVFALGGDTARAARMFAYGETLSRRDLPTQMWLIETQVQNGDIAGALRHYDRAMRTSVNARGTLIPVLVQAAANPQITTPLARLLATRPSWWTDFADTLVSDGTDATSLARLIAALRLSASDPVEQVRLAAALRHLVDLGGIAEASGLYQMARGKTASTGYLRNGGFETDGGLTPFEWVIADSADGQVVRESRDGSVGAFALSLYASIGGEAARELVVLPPGDYVVSGLVGSVPADPAARPSLRVACTANSGVPLAKASFPPARDAQGRGHIVMPFTVPKGCAGQWLFIDTGSSIDRPGEAPWIDSIAIRRRT